MGRLDENYTNNKWPKAPIIYDGRALRGKTRRIGADVKGFILTNDEILKNVVKKYRLSKRTLDETALAVQKWVVRFLTYKYDEEINDCPEFWQFPFETLQSEVGDCEDGAILITSLMIQAGVPAWRSKVAAGYVRATPTAPQGGHAYNIYLADDANWRIMDWCYYEDSNLAVKDKPTAKEGGQENAYKDVWFTFNNEYSWNQKSLKLGGRVANDRVGEGQEDKNEVLSEALELEDIAKRIDEKLNEDKTG